MSNITERLDRLREKIQTTDFLEGKGLSNEVNIQMFCYDPSEEMTVRHFLSQLEGDSSLQCHLIPCDLYRILLSICEDLGITDAIPDMEEEEGSAFLLEQIQSAAGIDEYVAKIRDRITREGRDVLLLTGVGDVFPFMRVHSLLEALQPAVSDMPILVMYPGRFDGNYLRLFNEMEPNPYYRAFNLIGEEQAI